MYNPLTKHFVSGIFISIIQDSHSIIPQWERLSVGTIPTNKMHPVGTVPMDKMQPVGTVRTDEIIFKANGSNVVKQKAY